LELKASSSPGHKRDDSFLGWFSSLPLAIGVFAVVAESIPFSSATRVLSIRYLSLVGGNVFLFLRQPLPNKALQ
jgi:hypothetical protein